MSTLTYTDLILLEPSFLTEDLTRQAQITRAIARTDRRLSAAAFGDDYDDAVLWLAAHQLSMSGRADVAVVGGTGAITSRTTGESITSYTPIKKGDGYDRYRATVFGSHYLEILLELPNLSPVSG